MKLSQKPANEFLCGNVIVVSDCDIDDSRIERRQCDSESIANAELDGQCRHTSISSCESYWE